MADSLMDDPTSVKCFEDWMKTIVGDNQSGVDGQTAAAAAHEDGDDTNIEVPEILEAGAPPSPELCLKAEDETKISPEVEPVSSAKAHIVSVAHKATRTPTPTPPSPKLASVSENNEASMAPTTQKEMIEKSPKLPRHDVGVLPERASSKANGLENSIHARTTFKSRQYQHPLPPPVAAPKTPEEASCVLKAEAGDKHDPMGFFDAKQKEYYPPKTMLQSKDPNAPMTKKPATALNPKAKECAADVAREDFDMTPMLNVLGARKKTPGVPPTVHVTIQEEGDDLEVDLGSLHGVRNVVFRFGCVHDAAAFRLGASGVRHG